MARIYGQNLRARIYGPEFDEYLSEEYPMALKFTFPGSDIPLWDIRELSRRLVLARERDVETGPRPRPRYMVAELGHLAELFKRPFRKLHITQADTPQTIMLLPGFVTHPVQMRYMARQLEVAGHTVKRWGMGFNFGPTPDNIALLESRVQEIYSRHGQPVVLIGWSLGGLFARELAHRQPDIIAKVITMGTPFSGNPRSNNAWRLYQLVTGHKVDNPPVATRYQVKPPVETVALWSPRDGVISPRSACGMPGERDRAVAIRCGHLDFACARNSMETVLQELEHTSEK